MYTRNNKVSSSIEDIVNYIEDTDVYNSSLIEKLRDPGLPREEYEIKTFEYRPDLIAKEVYGSTGYEGLLMVQTGSTLENLKKGVTLMLIPKENLDSLLRSF
jgi:hypothetical protein